jgi:hypothetical protein
MFPGTGEYDQHAYALGFHSAISIIGNNIEVNLNGMTIQQCEGHLLMQRFFAIFELAGQPFTKDEGPHQFVGPSGFLAAHNVTISGPGTIGRSAHHGK